MTTSTIEVHGTCTPRFQRVRNAFEEHLRTQSEIGAAVAVTVENEPVVDLWAGHRDATRTHPWGRYTIVNVFSTTKGMTALCANMLADRGQLDLGAPVAKYWPEFAQAGKERIPVRWLLGHRAGLAAVREQLPREAAWDAQRMAAALAAETPWWEPGTAVGYHAVTFGWLVGEVVRRVSGKSLGTFFREEVAKPLALDFYIGLPAQEDARVADMVEGPPQPGLPVPPASPLRELAFNNPVPILDLAVVNSRQWRAAELGAVNGHGNASALARVYGALASGGEVNSVRLLSQPSIDRLSVLESEGNDVMSGNPARFGPGFQLLTPARAPGCGPRTFGHGGAGGSLGYADPDAHIGFGYVMNQMGSTGAAALTAAVHACL